MLKKVFIISLFMVSLLVVDAKTLKITRDKTLLKDGPANYFENVLVLQLGTQCDYIEDSKEDADWVYVSVEGKKGYISKMAFKEGKASAKDKFSDLDTDDIKSKNTIAPSSYTAAIKGFAMDYSAKQGYQTDNIYQAIEYTEFNDKDMKKVRKETGLAYFPKKGELIGVEEAFINDRMASIGLSISVGVLQQGVVFDRELTKKMNALANILIRQTYDYDTRYYVFIIKDSEPVAFSGPGGYIFVSDKLLSLISDYKELVAILAHEVGHIALRHGVRDIALEQARFSADKAFEELDEFLDEDELAISKDLDSVIAKAREACKLVRDDKDEFEADKVSVELLRRYKIDKSNFLSALNKVTVALASKYPDYLSQTQRRITQLKGK